MVAFGLKPALMLMIPFSLGLDPKKVVIGQWIAYIRKS